MLTPYDEFPVHQAPYTFSHIPSTDYNWDDGYWFGVFSPEDGVFLGTGARINPNSDMIGGYAFINVAGHQTTVRFSRCWRGNFDVAVGPWRVTFIEPLRRIRLQLHDNDSPLSFDLMWEGASPPFLEEHHVAAHRGRRTTDQSRYSQPGKVSGWIKLADRTWEVDPDRWTGSRDHSWGLYSERPPLSPLASLLPPKQKDAGPQRSFRLWTCFRSDPWSGFFHMHEDADGRQAKFNDVFGTPFAGRIYRGWESDPIELMSGRHEIEFQPGTRIMTKATLHFEDVNGGKWRQIFEPTAPPWVTQTIGYHPGSWKDGGTFATYHGSEELALEWDAFDFSVQPFEYKPYVVSGEHAVDNFGEGTGSRACSEQMQGPEYLARVTTEAPDGSVSTGAAQVELFIQGRYSPYGLS